MPRGSRIRKTEPLPRLMFISGFLGAGKTTCIARMAGLLSAAGQRVAIVANDQSDGLIDTQLGTLSAKTSQVAGGCFCCRSDELAKILRGQAASLRPPVILAEPGLDSTVESEMFARRTSPMTHRSVRSLSRGLALIRELNVSGPLSVLQLAQLSGLHRTTCYRLLQTLQADGFVTFDRASASFGLTAQVRTLSEGVSTRDLSSQAALPPMVTLLNEVSWPSDFVVGCQSSGWTKLTPLPL